MLQRVTNTKGRNFTIDFFKLFFLTVVIVHHSGLLSGVMHHRYIGVDFFFIVSGYFLYRSCQKYGLGHFVRRRLNQLYPQYFLSFLLVFCIQGTSSLLQSIPELLMVQNIGITNHGGINYPAWYISVLFYGSILLWVVLNYVPEKFLSPVLVLIGSIGFIPIIANNAIECWSYYGVIYPPLFRGLSGLCCGILLSKYRTKLHFSPFVSALLFVPLMAEIFRKDVPQLLLLATVYGFTITLLCSREYTILNCRAIKKLIDTAMQYEYVVFCNHAACITLAYMTANVLKPDSKRFLVLVLSYLLIVIPRLTLGLESNIRKVFNSFRMSNTLNTEDCSTEEPDILMKLISKIQKNQFLFEELVKRDFKQKYKRTVLGMAWSIMSPLLQLVVMYFVFSSFFGNSTEFYITYLFAGNLLFNYYREATIGGMNALLSNAHIFTKINIPKYMFLLSKNVSAVINFGLTLVIFFLFAAIDGVSFGLHFFSLIYPIVCLSLFNIGIGLILSALYVFFRDISYLYDVFTMLLMYMSAIFYTLDNYSPMIQRLFLCNPIYCAIKYFRVVTIEGNIPSLSFHLLLAFYACAALAVGGLIYKKKNHEFLYYV